jgi:hypothetical protein
MRNCYPQAVAVLVSVEESWRQFVSVQEQPHKLAPPKVKRDAATTSEYSPSQNNLRTIFWV